MTQEHLRVQTRLPVHRHLGDTYKQNCTKTKIIASVNFTLTGVSLSFCAGGQWGFSDRHF